MEKGALIKILITIFIAVIFIASYASFGNNGTGTIVTSITTTIPPQTAYAAANVNGTVSGYGPIMSMFITCSNVSLKNSTIYSVSNTLTSLENNNSINNFFSPNQTTFTIYTANMNPYNVSTYLNSTIPQIQTACINFRSQTILTIPSKINFTVANQHVVIPIPANLRNYTSNTKIVPLNSKLPLRVSTLLTANGTIFGNLSVSAIGGN